MIFSHFITSDPLCYKALLLAGASNFVGGSARTTNLQTSCEQRPAHSSSLRVQEQGRVLIRIHCAIIASCPTSSTISSSSYLCAFQHHSFPISILATTQPHDALPNAPLLLDPRHLLNRSLRNSRAEYLPIRARNPRPPTSARKLPQSF